jgi:hypothetical protein
LAISSAADLEESLAQLCRLYRAHRELFLVAAAQDEASLLSWVRTGGKIMEKLDEVHSDIEVYSGVADLRITIAELKQMRAAKEAATEKS